MKRIKWHRVWGVVLRHWYSVRRDFSRSSEVFVHPVLDLAIWGITAVYFQSLFSDGATVPTVIISLVTAIIFWNILYRAQSETPFGILEELWNRNLLNTFISPLKFSEWTLGVTVSGLIKTALTLLISGVSAAVLYKFNIFFFGFHLIPFLLLLIMSGWALGFFIAGLVLRFGQGLSAMAWTLSIIIAPFSAIYYPVAILPEWAQAIAKALPTTYVFEGMREVINTGTLDVGKLGMSFTLNVAYLVLTAGFMYLSFKNRLKRGLLTLD